MSKDQTNIYEGLFLFPHAATGNLQAAVDHVKELLNRADAKVVSFRKWDERRLAYEIKGNKRGVYFLVYFQAPTQRIQDLERACNLSEQLLRTMFTRADHLTEEQIAAADGMKELHDEIKVRGSEDSGEGDQPAAVRRTAAVATASDESQGEG